METKFKETEIGRIPKDWEAVILGKITQVRGGIGFPLEYQGTLTGTYPLYKVSDMTLPGNEVYMQSANNYVDSHVARELRATIFPAQTVIFPKVGAAVYTNKKRMLSCEALIDNNVMGVTVKAIDQCLPYFLYTYFQTIDLTTLSNPGPLPSINAKRINSMEIPLPPLPEQHKIADILSTVDETTEKTNAIIQETQQLKKGLMQKLFTKGIGHTRFKETKIGQIPEEWEIKALGDLGDFFKGTSIKGSDIVEDGLPCIRYGDIYVQYESDNVVTHFSAFISRETAENSRRIYTGDILFAGTGETQEDIGKCVAYTFDEEAYAGGDLIVFRPKEEYQLNSVFLSYCMNSGEVAKSKSRLGQGLSIFHIYSRNLKTLHIPLPSISEQNTISGIISEVDTRIKTEQAYRSELEQLKKGLMQVLVTGKVRVKV